MVSPGRIPKLSASALSAKPPSKMISEIAGMVGPPVPRVKCGGTEPEITGISQQITSKEFEALAADYHWFQPPISTTRKVPSGLISQLTINQLRPCEKRPRRGASAASECLIQNTTQAICHYFIHVRCQLLTKISPDRCFMTWEIAASSVTSLIFENNVASYQFFFSVSILPLFVGEG